MILAYARAECGWPLSVSGRSRVAPEPRLILRAPTVIAGFSEGEDAPCGAELGSMTSTGSNLVYMDQQVAKRNSTVERFGKHVLAGLVLLVAAWIVVKLVVGIVVALFVPVLAVVAIIAVIWALRVLL